MSDKNDATDSSFLDDDLDIDEEPPFLPAVEYKRFSWWWWRDTFWSDTYMRIYYSHFLNKWVRLSLSLR